MTSSSGRSVSRDEDSVRLSAGAGTRSFWLRHLREAIRREIDKLDAKKVLILSTHQQIDLAERARTA